MMTVIEKEFKDWTVLAVAHILEAIRNFDRVVSLDKG
jgi:ABC-type transport system involved in cytochrome bd biosynthesis fused ATPase/permease subunit